MDFYQKNNPIHKTVWAKEFWKEAPRSYNDAIQLALTGEDLSVSLIKTRETGVWQWSISVVEPYSDKDFWMDSKPTKREAMKIIKQFGWTLIK